jgi:hypothetical protein
MTLLAGGRMGTGLHCKGIILALPSNIISVTYPLFYHLLANLGTNAQSGVQLGLYLSWLMSCLLILGKGGSNSLAYHGKELGKSYIVQWPVL